LNLPSRPLGDNGALAIPIGPSGILVGTAVRDDPQLGVLADDLAMLPLTYPQRATASRRTPRASTPVSC
jgi:hypothetical protein